VIIPMLAHFGGHGDAVVPVIHVVGTFLAAVAILFRSPKGGDEK
jgi:hypothetical protein